MTGSFKQVAAPLAAIAAGLASAAASAQPNWFIFEPPLYGASPSGTPLAGQDRWYRPGAAADWNVHTFDGNPWGLPRPHGLADQFVAGAGPGAGTPALAQFDAPAGWGRNHDLVTVRIAVQFQGRPPAGEEIGRISLEPLGESSGAALVARWSDPTAETWDADLLWYDSDGREHITPVPNPAFQNLQAGTWYEWKLHRFWRTNQLSVSLRRSGVPPWDQYGSPEWFAGGGAAGALPPPRSLRLTAGDPQTPGSVMAVDLLHWDSERCYPDCNGDGNLDFFDFLCFQDRFLAQDPYADCDGNGVFDFFDLLCFMDEMGGTCP